MNYSSHRLTLFILVLILSVGSAIGQTTQPAKNTVQEVMAYCPPGTFGVIHFETKVLAGELKKFQDLLFKYIEEHKNEFAIDSAGLLNFVKNQIEPMIRICRRSESIDVYIFSTERQKIGFCIVVRGQATPQDVWNVFPKPEKELPKTSPAVEAFPTPSLQPGKNGRYAIAPMGIFIVYGKEASDLPDGVMLIAMGDTLHSEFIAQLGKKSNSKLLAVLKQVDCSAPIWGGAAGLSEILEDDEAPESVCGILDPRGTGKLDVKLLFTNKEYSATGDIKVTIEQFFTGFFKVELKDNTLRLSLVPSDKPFAERLFGGLMPSLLQARFLAKQAVSMANLNAIGMGVVLYQAEHEDRYPPDLDSLVSEGQSVKLMISPLSGKKPPVWDKEKQKLIGPVDYILIDYSKTKNIPGSNVVLAYEDPANYANLKDKKIPVLFVDCHVELLDPKMFKAYVAAAKAFQAGKPLPKLPEIPQDSPPDGFKRPTSRPTSGPTLKSTDF